MNLSYKEQLADREWLKKKNEILERDNYTCQKCGATSHLNVHHLVYDSGRKAWEYPNDKLITLCERCHAIEHKTTRPYVGEVYKYEHSGYTNYMVCYGINKMKKEVYLLGLDDGGSMSSPLFECVSFNTFSFRYSQMFGFWDNLFQEESFWQESLIRILVSIYNNKVKNFYVSGFTYPDKSVLEYARKTVWSLVNTREDLLFVFNNILNED